MSFINLICIILLITHLCLKCLLLTLFTLFYIFHYLNYKPTKITTTTQIYFHEIDQSLWDSILTIGLVSFSRSVNSCRINLIRIENLSHKNLTVTFYSHCFFFLNHFDFILNRFYRSLLFHLNHF